MYLARLVFAVKTPANTACTDEVGSQGCEGKVDQVGCRGTKNNNIPLALLRVVQKRGEELYNELGVMSPQNGAKRHLLYGVHTTLCLGHRSFLFAGVRRGAMGSVSSNPREYE